MCKSMSGTPGNISRIIRMQDLTLPAFQPVNVRQRKSDIVFLARELLQCTHSYVFICCPFHCGGFLSPSLYLFSILKAFDCITQYGSLLVYSFMIRLSLWLSGLVGNAAGLCCWNEWLIHLFMLIVCACVDKMINVIQNNNCRRKKKSSHPGWMTVTVN